MPLDDPDDGCCDAVSQQPVESIPTRQAARHLRMSVATVDQWARTGRLVCTRGADGNNYFSPADLDAAKITPRPTTSENNDD